MNGKTKVILFLVGALFAIYAAVLQQTWASVGENRKGIKENASQFTTIEGRLVRIETKIDNILK